MLRLIKNIRCKIWNDNSYFILAQKDDKKRSYNTGQLDCKNRLLKPNHLKLVPTN